MTTTNNSRNGKYNTTNKYYVTDATGETIVATLNTRNEARKVKRTFIKCFKLKNTDVKILQLTASVVR